MLNVNRNHNNPIIQSDNQHPWRSLATFNCSPVEHEGHLHLIYRAMGDESLYRGHKMSVSTIGHAISTSSEHDNLTEEYQLIKPEKDWEIFGCEDPRVTKIGDTYYIFYTALGGFPFDATNIKVAVATTKDLKEIDEKRLVTPFNAKAMALFPEKVGGKWTVILTADSDKPPSKLAIAQFDEFEDLWDQKKWANWYANIDKYSMDLRRKDTDHCEVGAVPILTEKGWLLIYSHIQNYFDESNRVFGIEAVLLDKKDPRKIIARTRYPFMVPIEGYEQYGQIPNIVFPSGAHVKEDTLTVFYGAADTTCASANLSLSALLEEMDKTGEGYAERYKHNPILNPIKDHNWESSYVLNPAAIDIEGEINIVYRAISPDNTSTMGLATSKHGYAIDHRLAEPIYVPRTQFETKQADPNGNSGCEDGRLVRIGNKIYTTYTGYNGRDLPAVAASSISVEDFKARNWDNWSEPELISPPGIDDKDAAIFPEKINGKYMVLHRIDHHVCADFIDKLDFKNNKLTRCIQIFGPRKGMWDSKKVGINGPPFLTEAGWILFYHGINDNHSYCMGAVLLDREDPTVIIGRSAAPIMEPYTAYEKEGWINDVVFSCGQVVRDNKIFIYYGGADSVVCVATLELDKLVTSLKPL